eukprot:476799-Alexandrium_andersonii.AAC.1
MFATPPRQSIPRAQSVESIAAGFCHDNSVAGISRESCAFAEARVGHTCLGAESWRWARYFRSLRTAPPPAG